MNLQNLIGQELNLVKTTNSGNIFVSKNKVACLLKPVNRDYSGVIKKPLYYLSAIEGGRSTYLSGLFATDDNSMFSADYKDTIGLKHLVKIQFADDGKRMIIG